MDPAGKAPADEVIASSGVTFQLWRLYQHAWLVCLFFPLVALVGALPATFRLVLGLLALLFFAGSYTWLMWPHPVSQGARTRTRSRTSFLLLLVLSLLVFVFSLVDGPAWLWLFIGTSAIAGTLLPMRSAFAAVVLFTLLPLFITVVMKGGITGVDWWWLIALMLLVRGLGLDMIGVARLGSAIRELHAARRELARLAVMEERLRVARDLHDLLGHALSMIALKSELARRLVEHEPMRAAQEINEVEVVARQTLREVREAVGGYRQPTLQSELEGARQLLEAAGIDHQLELTVGELPSAIDAVLAWVVREGVTNVVRHSRARRCSIRVRQTAAWVHVEVTNDTPHLSKQGLTLLTMPAHGSGLSGLAERVDAHGGHFEAGPALEDGAVGFRLQVKLPLFSPEQHGAGAALAQANQTAEEEAMP
jgi:two-component system sensor histidine kinase DesK